MSDIKDILNTVVDSVLNDDHDAAGAAFKTYATQKSQELINPDTPPVQQEQE